MLAQNFKAPAELGLSDKEVESLVGILGMLERGEFKHADFFDADAVNGFNMTDYENECGSVCCIAGWSDKLFGTNFSDCFSSAVDDLFLMQNDKITPAQAAIALRNYLTHGKPRWAEALEWQQ